MEANLEAKKRGIGIAEAAEGVFRSSQTAKACRGVAVCSESPPGDMAALAAKEAAINQARLHRRPKEARSGTCCEPRRPG